MFGGNMRIPTAKQYPASVSIRGETYKILFVKNLDCLGETNWEDKTIKIRAGMSKNETFRTFIHESLHAIEFDWPVNLKHKTVYKLEKAIFQFLLDNFL
jgi:hypothetical protein